MPFFFLIIDYIVRNHPTERLFNMVNSVWFVFGSFMQTEVEVIPRRNSARVLAIMVWIFAFVIVAAYIACKLN